MRSNGGTRSATALPSRPDLVLPYGISLRRTEKAPRGVRTSRLEFSVSPVSKTTIRLAEEGGLTGVIGANWRRGAFAAGGVAAAPNRRIRRDVIFQRLPGSMVSPPSKRHGSTAAIAAPCA